MRKQQALSRTLVTTIMFAALVMISKPTSAQERPGNPLPNTVWVGADGKYESDPDTALVQFGISAQDKKLQDASQKASQEADQIRQLLRSVKLSVPEVIDNEREENPVVEVPTESPEIAASKTSPVEGVLGLFESSSLLQLAKKKSIINRDCLNIW